MKKRKNIDTVAIDFDGTIVLKGYPDISNAVPVSGALEAIKALREAGYVLVLFTCREDEPNNINKKWLTDAVNYLKDNGIEFDYLNETPYDIDFRSKECLRRKPLADLYIDDRGCIPGTFSWKKWAKYLLVEEQKEEKQLVLFEEK